MVRNDKKTVVVSVKLSKKTHRTIKKIAKREKKTENQVMAGIIENALEKIKNEWEELIKSEPENGLLAGGKCKYQK
ncbi:MAG: hypothetical protein AAB851_02355 [Patescibacteria group bacterium]